jgi:hypothetical protein
MRSNTVKMGETSGKVFGWIFVHITCSSIPFWFLHENIQKLMTITKRFGFVRFVPIVISRRQFSGRDSRFSKSSTIRLNRVFLEMLSLNFLLQ